MYICFLTKDPCLSIADVLAMRSVFLRVQVIVQDLIEARQAHTFRFFLFVVANCFSAPDALDHKGRFSFFCFVHAVDVTPSTLNAG